MPESANQGGAVRGPAPQGSNSVARLCLEHKTATSMSVADEAPETTAPPIPDTVDSNVDSLGLDAQYVLRAEVMEANRDLAEAYSKQEQHEKRLDCVCSNLLISGERIPALDQSSFSMIQEAYINASTAALVSSEKIIILQERVNRLEQQLRTLICGTSRQSTQKMRRAA